MIGADIIKQRLMEESKFLHSDYSGFFIYLPDNLKFPITDVSLVYKFNLTHGQKIKDKAIGKQIIEESISNILVKARKTFMGTDKEWEEGVKQMFNLLRDLTQNDKEVREIYKSLKI